MRAGEYLKSIDYPGRIIASGTDIDGKDVFVYAITGRSESSRNRVLESTCGQVFTRVYDSEAELVSPELLVYQAVVAAEDFVLIGNGDHTGPLSSAVEDGKALDEAFAEICYEPDAPSFTPRIASLITSDASVFMIARKNGDKCERRLYRYPKEKGIMHIIHTYSSNGSPLPSFSSLPVRAAVSPAEEIWNALSSDFRVALYYRHGSYERVINAKGE